MKNPDQRQKVSYLSLLLRGGLFLMISLILSGAFGPVQVSDAGPGSASSTAISRNSIQYWIDKYAPEVPRENPKVQRVYRIFDKILEVADKPKKRDIKLTILNSKGDPWAISLPDGYIVLSTSAVDTCYGADTQAEIDARIAFVLGHEVGHMAQDDFWHLESFISVQEDPSGSALKRIFEKNREAEDFSEKEIRADERGFFYAAMAGYRVDLLIREGTEKTDFFTHWLEQIPRRSFSKDYPSPKERAAFLRIRLKDMLEKLDYFKFGVRLANFGKYADAIYFFQEFRSVFPSREVFNNLGYCNLRLAMKEMPRSIAYEYWLPLAMDLHTRAEALSLRGEDEYETLPENARRSVEEAVEYLKLACDADQYYVPARVNLACAYFFVGNFSRARAVIDEAKVIAPEDPDVLTLRALILYQEKEADMWPKAVEILEEVAQSPDAPAFVDYNLAILLEERGRSGKAGHLWKGLGEKVSGIPSPFKQVVCKAAGLPAPDLAESASASLPWSSPVAIGIDLMTNEGAKKRIEDWSVKSVKFRNMVNGHIYRNEENLLLVLDGYVEMVVLLRKGSAADVREACRGKVIERPWMGGSIHGCNPQWSALVQDGDVKEVWIARQSD